MLMMAIFEIGYFVYMSTSTQRAVETAIPYVTTRAAAAWTVRALRAARRAPISVRALQDLTAR